MEQELMRIHCRNYCFNASVRGEKVILEFADPSDKSQHWIQDYNVGNLTDEEGSRAFALVNPSTGQAMMSKHGTGKVQLAPYSGHVTVELSKLWSLGQKGPDGYSSIRVLQDINYSLNAFGYPKDGTIVGTYKVEHSRNSLWKIVPINELW